MVCRDGRNDWSFAVPMSVSVSVSVPVPVSVSVPMAGFTTGPETSE